MTEQQRDEEGRFAKSDYEPMNALLRRRGRFRARTGEKVSPENETMNKLLLKATGRLPLDDDEAA